MPGPAPDPASLREARRLREGTIETLPKERVGDAPGFPLTKPTTREKALWVAMWRKPQAVIWERQGLEYEVAMHVRTLVESEARGASASLRSLLLRQAGSLLLTERALLAGGYRISSVRTLPTVAAAGESAADVKRRTIPSARGRLKALPDPEGK
jgi:hypothetical protein